MFMKRAYFMRSCTAPGFDNAVALATDVSSAASGELAISVTFED
jgi:hypothetical protein